MGLLHHEGGFFNASIELYFAVFLLWRRVQNATLQVLVQCN